jgi:hypothetical protein
MIKRLKKPCYIAICDNCGEELGYDYTVHCLTKEELLEILEEIAEVDGKRHFCSQDCYNKFTDRENSKREKV